MLIRFPKRSGFLKALRLGIKLGRSALDSGQPIEIQLEPGGYHGRWIAVIRPEDDEEFEVSGSMRDPTRFPQRIRAAAWALHREGASGRFEIMHDRESGIVTIRRDI